MAEPGSLVRRPCKPNYLNTIHSEVIATKGTEAMGLKDAIYLLN